MKKWIGFLFLLFTIPVLIGMGSLQGTASPEKIPIPVKKYTAVFVDQMDIATECSETSIEGTTFLEGKRGEGTFTISFDNIDQISFRMNAERLTGMVKLRDGGTSELTLNKTQKAFGQTKYGTFQIKLSDLKKLVIRTTAPR
ncbi:MAG: hypothetical protein NT047_16025 [Deltaproteobacteria bacterium]|nr:hypothetical protein [Deltaproteobacteria bacterium]